jgi:hypothetical protein
VFVDEEEVREFGIAEAYQGEPGNGDEQEEKDARQAEALPDEDPPPRVGDPAEDDDPGEKKADEPLGEGRETGGGVEDEQPPRSRVIPR